MIENIIEKLTDNFIAVFIIIAVICMVFLKADIPDFIILAFGIALDHYLKRKS